MRSRTIALASAAALLAALAPAVAQAVPPGGPVESPGGAIVALAAPAAAPSGSVAFTGTGFLAGERVTVKIDDGTVRDAAGSDIFATVDAAPDGTVAGTVELSRTATPLADGAHGLRFLSSTSGGTRSFHVDFTVAAATTAPPPPTPEPGAGPPSQSGPPSDAGAATPLRVASTRLRVKGGRVALTLRGGTAATKVKVTVRTRAKVRLHGRRAIATVVKAKTVRVRANARATVRLRLTAAGTTLVRRGPVKVKVRIAPTTGGTPTTAVLVVRG